MAFSFFKKSDTKMPIPESVSARTSSAPMGMKEVSAPKPVTPAAPLVSKGSSGDLLSPPGLTLAEPNLAAQKQQSASSVMGEDWTAVFADTHTRVNGGYGVEILEEESDPYTEICEHAAIAYANGQNAVARSTLESAIQDNADPEALKLWHMLFDLFRVTGDHAAFDALGVKFAQTCELSPPSWSLGGAKEGRSADGGAKASAKTISGLVALQGVLSSNASVFEILRKALVNKEARRLDFGKMAGIDAEGAAALADILSKARRLDLAWGLSQGDAQAERLAVRLASAPGDQNNLGFWQLLFELYQFLGKEEDFEEKAVDYAVAFELSPPSWEPPKTPPAIPDSAVAAAAAEASKEGAEGESAEKPARPLEGNLMQGNLDAVQRLLKKGEENRLDFSGIVRMDFVTAGQLVNVLKAAKHVTIVHPNRLIAELLRVMGVDLIAKVELAKY